MMAIVDHVRNLPDGSVRAPTLVLYSRGDLVVDPDVTEEVMPRLAAGPLDLRVVTGSGDPEEHVIAGDIVSPETTDEVLHAILDFVTALD